MLDRQFQQNPLTYSFQKVEGFIALPFSDVFLEEQLSPGERVSVFFTPTGKYFISKDPAGFLINKITSAYIFFDAEHIQMEEK